MDLPGIMNHVGERLGVLRNNVRWSDWQTDLLRFGHNLGDWAPKISTDVRQSNTQTFSTCSHASAIQ